MKRRLLRSLQVSEVAESTSLKQEMELNLLMEGISLSDGEILARLQ